MTEGTACTLKEAIDKMLEPSIKTDMAKHQEESSLSLKMLDIWAKIKKKIMEFNFSVYLTETF